MSEHELWNELGNLYFMSGAYDQAVFAYHRSIQLESGFGRPYSNLALTYVQQGKFEQAVELYRASLELLIEEKDMALSWSRLGNVYRHLKRYPDAVAAYQRADELDPLISETRDEPDQLLYHSMDPDAPETKEALLNLVAAEPIQLADEMPDFPLETPSLSIEAELIEEPPVLLPAESDELPNLATAEPDLVAELSAAEALIAWAEEIHQPEEEDADLISVFEQDPEVYFPAVEAEALADWLPIPEPIEPAASIAEQDARASAPEEQDQRVIEAPAFFEFPAASGPAPALLAARVEAARDAEHAEAVVQYAEVDLDEALTTSFVLVESPTAALEPDLLTALDDDEAESAAAEALNIELEIPRLKRLVQINPQNAVTWNTLGNLYKFAGLYKDAILAYQQATSVDPEKSQYFHNLAMAYAAEGRDEDAIISLQRVLELNPDHSLTHATLGGYYRKMGLEELAQRHIGKAMKHIYDSESEYNRACLEAICGNTDQAIDLLRVALANKQTYVDWVLRDPDLDTIREDRRFKQLISDFT